jgi:hypothetical protein
MINQKRIEKPSINKDIEINLDVDFKSNSEPIDSTIINLSRDIINDLLEGKSEGNRIKLSGSLISFQLFIYDIIEKSKTKPDNNPSGSYGDPIIKQTKN